MTAANVQRAMASLSKPETLVAALCADLGVTRRTLYRYVARDGSLRAEGRKVLAQVEPAPLSSSDG